MNKFRSRRYWLVVGCGVTFTLLLVGAYIGGPSYQILMQSIIGAYLASSYAEKRLEKPND